MQLTEFLPLSSTGTAWLVIVSRPVTSLAHFCNISERKHLPSRRYFDVIFFFFFYFAAAGPPLWSSGQSSWLQIRRPGFDSRHYQKKKRVVGLERGALGLVSTIEELLDRKVAAPV
jgi:hypothetical protein